MAARLTMPANDKDNETDIASAEAALALWLRAQEQKELVRFVTIGSVDDGKSTLIGRLLHDAHGLYSDQLDAVRRASVKGSTRGAGSSSEIDFSLFTDGLMAEREQGITIDVAYRYFATEKRKFIIADTPGHVQYTRNMATGASTADVAVILIDARLGVLPQTRRHAKIASMLGIPHVVACVNKMDLVGFDEARFQVIVEELAQIAKRVQLSGLVAIPVSALDGDNVVTPTTHMPWWTGGTMLEHLETVPVGETARQRAPLGFRFPVQLVLRPGINYRAFAGQIVSGSISVGDEVVALPSGKKTTVTGVDFAGVDLGTARAPQSVALRLADEIDVSRGNMLVRAEDLPLVATDADADLVWMSERPLDPEKSYLLKHTTNSVRATIEVIDIADSETLQSSPAEKGAGLALNDIGRVRVRCRAPIFFDPYFVNRGTGAFILIDSVTNDTVAAGMLAGAYVTNRAEPRPEVPTVQSLVTRAERRERLGQSGAVVSLYSPTRTEAFALCFALERELFDRGLVATVLGSSATPAANVVARLEAAAVACAEGGLFAILPLAAGFKGAYSAQLRGQWIVAKDAADLVQKVADAVASGAGSSGTGAGS